MKLKAKSLVYSVALAMVLAALGALPGAAYAQQYPSQDIRLVCAFPPGSGADVLVRYFGEKLRPIANRTIIVENKAGAGGNIATEYTARAKPDGHTIYVHAASGVAANVHIFKKPPVDVSKTILIAATINRQPFMMVVDAKSPYKTVADVTAAMKQKGAKANYATSAPTGTVMGEIYKARTGVQALEINYKTAQDCLNELLSGKTDYGMMDPQFSLAQVREGRLRVLAISTEKRLQATPEYPTMTELGVPMDITGWFAAMVPAGTPKPIVTKINQWFTQIVKTDETKNFLNSYGGDPFIVSPEEGQALFLKSIKDWEEYVRIAKIEPRG
ncbi:MAG: Extra-cytoplasmic solute receptor [Deltaproteobacteria bacterium]|nr:Extra-cytoplasmic solute receptor [Deltaproteobacteria bacterium]